MPRVSSSFAEVTGPSFFDLRHGRRCRIQGAACSATGSVAHRRGAQGRAVAPRVCPATSPFVPLGIKPLCPLTLPAAAPLATGRRDARGRFTVRVRAAAHAAGTHGYGACRDDAAAPGCKWQTLYAPALAGAPCSGAPIDEDGDSNGCRSIAGAGGRRAVLCECCHMRKYLVRTGRLEKDVDPVPCLNLVSTPKLASPYHHSRLQCRDCNGRSNKIFIGEGEGGGPMPELVVLSDSTTWVQSSLHTSAYHVGPDAEGDVKVTSKPSL